MIIIKSQFKKYFVAKFKDININIILLLDVHNDTEYLKFSLFTRKTDPYIDMYFSMNMLPEYVKNIYEYIQDNNKISYSEDMLSYVMQGPLLDDKKIYKMSIFFINDYNMMMKRSYDFVYDEYLSTKMAEDHLLPIYKAIK